MPKSFRPILISFCGPDGVGKSTQVAMLSYYLMKQGSRVTFCWIRVFHGIAYLVVKLFKKFGYQAPPITNKIDRYIWFFIEFAGLVPRLLLQTVLPLKLGYIVIAERHLLDTIVSLSLFIYRDPNFVKSKEALFLLRLIPRNSIFIFLNASPDMILKRRIKRLGEFDRHLLINRVRTAVQERLSIEIFLYRCLVNLVNGIIVDASKSPMYILKTILNRINLEKKQQ